MNLGTIVGRVEEKDEFGLTVFRPITLAEAAHLERRQDLEVAETRARLEAWCASLQARRVLSQSAPNDERIDLRAVIAERDAMLGENPPKYFRAAILGFTSTALATLKDWIDRGLVKMWRIDNRGQLWLERR